MAAIVIIFVPLIVCALFPIDSAQYQWRCSDYDISENKYYIPDFGEPLTVVQASAGVKVEDGKTYVYPAEISCALGTVTDIQFCYSTRSNTIDKGSIGVFTLLTLIQNGDFFTVTNNILVSSTPTSDKCSANGGTRQCCDVVALSSNNMFEIPSENFSIGIGPSNAIDVFLLAFEASNVMYTAPCYVTSQSLLKGSTYNLTGLLGNESLLHLRLYIRPKTTRLLSSSANVYLSSVTDTPTPSNIDTGIVSTSIPVLRSEVVDSFSLSLGSLAITGVPSSSELPMPILLSSSYSPDSSDAIDTPVTINLPMTLPTVGIPVISSMVPQTAGATESNEARADRLGPILGGALGGIISIFVVVILIVLLVLIPLRRRQTWMKQHRPNEMAIDNAIYCIREGTAAKGSLEYSREYAEVGPFSDDVSSNRFPEYGPVSSANPIFLHDDLQNERHYECDDIYMEPAKNMDGLYAQIQKIQLDTVTRESVRLSDKIGAGQFGDVFQGIWDCTRRSVEVAVKTLKEGSDEEDKVKFLQEATIMGQFKHPNVVTMYGVVTDGEPILLVLEMLAKGDLRNYLLSMKTDDGVSDEIDRHELLSYCRQVASGMVYLSSKSFVHRDLAARNILVSDDRICKIADFGMSRDLADENYYVSHGGVIPVKWTAPEALNYMKYSTASDVWSFGMVMYEIWSVGHKPFEGVKNIRVIEMVNSGYRPPPPPGCPRVIYSIMMSCWHFKAESRPDFTAIASQLSVSNSKLLHWSGEDRTNYPKATDIGASLKHGEKLYKDLQLKYKFQNSLSQDIP